MPDILSSAQTQTDDAPKQPAAVPPVAPPPPMDPPADIPNTTAPLPVQIPDHEPPAATDPAPELNLPFSQHAQTEPAIPKNDVPLASQVHQPAIDLPTEPAPVPAAPPPVSVAKNGKPKSAIVSLVIFFLLTIPLSAYFVSQQRALTDQRSKAVYVTKPSEFYVANLDKTSFSVAWKEDVPAKGCVSAKNTKTQKETKACDDILSRFHLVTLTNLDPYVAYSLSGQGGGPLTLHPMFGGSIVSGLFDKSKPPTTMITGTINQSSGEPLKDAFVIVSPVLTDRFYFPIAATTNQNGDYNVDLSLIDAQSPPPYEHINVEVVNRQGQTLIEQKVPRPTGGAIPTVSVP